MVDSIIGVLMDHLEERISLKDGPGMITVGQLSQELIEAIRPTNQLEPTELIQKMSQRGLNITRQFIRECQSKRITSEEEAVQFLKVRK